jgi:hypothetical protein
MVQINITEGQGITQAIATKAGLTNSDCKKIDISIWQQVMQEVKTANSQQNDNEKFYTGGEDIENLNNKQNFKTDFKVAVGTVIELAENIRKSA